MLKGKISLITFFLLGLSINGVLMAQDQDSDFKTLIKDAEEKIESYAKEKGFKTERDDQNRLIMKDGDGKFVPVPQDLNPMNKIIEKKIGDFASKNGFTTAKNSDGRLVVRDKEGKVVPLPPDVLPPGPGNHPPEGNRPPAFSEEDLSVIKDAEEKITAYAKEKGFTVSRDSQGRIGLKDADGKSVLVPFEMVPINKIVEKRIQDFAQKGGFTTEKDKMGRLIVKDKDGKIVPLPPQLFPPGFRPSLPRDRVVEGKFEEYAKEKGYTLSRDEEGRLRLQDSNGKIIEPPKDLLPPKVDEASSDPSDKGLKKVGTQESPDAQGNPPEILGK
ncbi:MAG: hypothetical protein WA705_27240 [Candidatus Ozemobacteraceae bacterium]